MAQPIYCWFPQWGNNAHCIWNLNLKFKLRHVLQCEIAHLNLWLIVMHSICFILMGLSMCIYLLGVLENRWWLLPDHMSFNIKPIFFGVHYKSLFLLFQGFSHLTTLVFTSPIRIVISLDVHSVLALSSIQLNISIRAFGIYARMTMFNA